MTEKHPPNAPDKKYIFIDAMVIQSAGSSQKSKSEAVIKCLNELEKEGYKIAISEFTGYENLHGLSVPEMKKAGTLLSKFENKIITKQVLIMSALFGGFYHDQKVEGISHGDKIIAATALLEDGLILTENHKDFPNPFFIREKYLPVSYEVGNHHNKTIDYVLYKPDVALISKRLREKSI